MSVDVKPQFESFEKARSLPIVNTAANVFTYVYCRVKGVHPLLSKTLDFCETATTTIAAPLISNFEKPIQRVDGYACQGINYVSEKFPVITKPPEKIVETIVEPASKTLQNIKEYGTETVNTMVQKPKDYVLNNKTTKVALDKIEIGLKGVNHLVDQYCPLDGEKDITENNTSHSVEGSTDADTAPAKAMVIIGLLLQIHKHVYTYIKKQIKQSNIIALSKLDQLTGVITLLENAKADGKPSERLVQKAKEISGSLLSVYTTAQALVSNIPGVMNVSVNLVRTQMQDLYNVFAKAETISDIPWNMLTFARETIKKTKESLTNMLIAAKGTQDGHNCGEVEMNDMNSEEKKTL